MKGKDYVFVSWLYHLVIGSAQTAVGFSADGFTFVQRRNPSIGIGIGIGRGRNIDSWIRQQYQQHYHCQQRNRNRNRNRRTTLFGWLENFFEPDKSSSSTSSTTSDESRRLQYPEQYPATYELLSNDEILDEDEAEAKWVRCLLKNTQLQSRPLQLVYDANRDGWDPVSFHEAVDGRGASVVMATDRNGRKFGGYNPKGHASLGGARPSVAAFLFYERTKEVDNDDDDDNDDSQQLRFRFQKLQKVGGGGLACASDDPGFGISFGPDALVIGLQAGRETLATSKLGPYFERGPEDLQSLFPNGATELAELKVLVGCYEDGDDIPYSGGVLDMTSG